MPKVDRGHQLSGAAQSHAYGFELECEGQREDQVNLLERTRFLLRRARIEGSLDDKNAQHLSAGELEFLSEACRCEGIPVLADYPVSMRGAVKSYGQLLAALFYRRQIFTPEKESAGIGSELKWAGQLASTLHFLTRRPSSYDDGTTEADVKREIAAFSSVAHGFPDLLQAFLTVADHVGAMIPTLHALRQPTTQIWSALDVTSDNFLAAIRAQPAFFTVMSGNQFELVVAQVFRKHGFEVVATKQSHDGGYDLRVAVPLMSKLKTAFLVECKNPKNGSPTGVSVIRGLKGIADDAKRGTAGGIVVTSTTFSAAAKKEALASGWNIALYNRNDLLELLNVMDRIAR